MKDILWDKVMLEDFRRLACLTDDEDRVLTGWASGWSIVKIADRCGMCDRTVNSVIRSLRQKYDSVRKYSPLLPPRK